MTSSLVRSPPFPNRVSMVIPETSLGSRRRDRRLNHKDINTLSPSPPSRYHNTPESLLTRNE